MLAELLCSGIWSLLTSESSPITAALSRTLSVFPLRTSISSFCSLTPQASSPHFPTVVDCKHFTLTPLLFTSAFRLLFHEASSTGLHLSGPKGNRGFSDTFGLSSTDKVKNSSGPHLWLVWFLFTLRVLGLFSSAGKFFPHPVLHHPRFSASPVFTVYVCVLAWPCQASAHWCFSELSPQPKEHTAPLTSNCLYPLQRQTSLRQQRRLDTSLPVGSPIQRPRPECVAYCDRVCVCVRARVRERKRVSGRAAHMSSDIMRDTWKTYKKEKKKRTHTDMQVHFQKVQRVRCGEPQTGDTTQSRGRQEQSGLEGLRWRINLPYWAKTHPEDVNSMDSPMPKAGMKVFSAFASGVTSSQGLKLKFLQSSYRHLFNISHGHLKKFSVFIIKSFFSFLWQPSFTQFNESYGGGFGSRASTSVG